MTIRAWQTSLAALFVLACGGGTHDTTDGGRTNDGAVVGGDAGVLGWDAGPVSAAGNDVGLVFGTATPSATGALALPASPKQAATTAAVSIAPRSSTTALRRKTPLPAEIVPGRLIVTFKPGQLQDASALHRWNGLASYRFKHHTSVGPNTITVDVSDAVAVGRAISRDETHTLASRLASHPSVRAVEPDRIRRRTQLPDDPVVPVMWDLRQANVPGAWDIGTGASTVVVAVVDDGVKAHPDLPALLPGYDFVTDATSAMDGDGRDADPSPVAYVDPADKSVVWHGEHVSGTIAAIANNKSGIAGIDWHCRILPVRVIGKDGATASDALAGIYWAAGFDVPGVPSNPNPAQVINLSLGSQGLSTAEQQAIAAVIAKGVVVVAAAGNDDVDASDWAYAAYPGVIAVGALDRMGRRATYSNYGPVVSIMAPGGDMDADADGDGEPDGIISLWFSDDGKQPTLSAQQGTSMAAPHVTGVVSLMKAINPALTPAQVLKILQDTAVPSGKCTEGCGAGAMNAAAALMAAKAVTDWTQEPTLQLGSDRLHVNASGGRLAIMNAGGGTLTWSIGATGPNATALQLVPASGSVAAKAGASVSFSVNGSGLAPGYYTTYVNVTSNAGSQLLPVSFAAGSPTVKDEGFAYFLVYDGTTKGSVAGSTYSRAELGYTFFVKTLPGTWYMTGWIDLNNDYKLTTGDLWGAYQTTAGKPKSFAVASGDVLGPYDLSLPPY